MGDIPHRLGGASFGGRKASPQRRSRTKIQTVAKRQTQIVSSEGNDPLSAMYPALERFISNVPKTAERKSDDPVVRARAIANTAAAKAALISGGLAIPPGPFGLLTVIPDLIAIWKLQAQMVADIAGCFGKASLLTREQMVYCLFRHAAAQLVRDLVTRVGYAS